MIAASRNRLRLLFGVFILLTACLPKTVTAQSKPQVQLTTEVLEQSYCSIGQQTSLQLKLKLRYRNLSDQRVIVYKGHDLFFQTKIRTEPNSETAAYEVLLLNMRYFDEEPERIDAPSPSRVFAKLAPGESFERDLITGVGVVEATAMRSANSVRPGQHTLQVIVSTWYQSPKLAEKLRQEWQREGSLWWQPLVSIPLKLSIEKPATTVPCR